MKTLTYIIRMGLAGSLLAAAGSASLLAQKAAQPVVDAPAKPVVNAPVVAPVMKPAQAAASEEAEDVVVLEAFHVKTSGKEGSYIGSETTAGTRVVADIVDMPFAVQVLSKDFIDDFQLFNFEEQSAYIGGMVPDDPANGHGSAVTLRGYGVPFFRNGFRRTQKPESNSIRQVETIRGPQSALFGRAAPGGVVNFLSKNPQTRFKTGASFVMGSYNNQRASAYVTGPLVARKLYYRLDAEYYDMGRNTDYWFDRTTNISGSVLYKFNADTALTLEFEHSKKLMNDSTVAGYYIDRTGDPTYDLIRQDPANAAYQHPQTWRRVNLHNYSNTYVRDQLTKFNSSGSERRTKRENDSFYLRFEHRFEADISMRVNAGYSKRDFNRHTPSSPGSAWDPDRVSPEYPYGRWGLQSASLAGDPGYRQQILYQQYDYEEYGVQMDFTKNWRTAVKQSTLLTFDYFRETESRMEWSLRGNPTATTGANATMRDAIAKMLGYASAADLPQATWTAYSTPDPFNMDAVYSLPEGRTITARELYSLRPDFNSSYAWTPYNGHTGMALMYNNIYDVERTTYGALLSHQVSLLDDRVYLIGTLRQDYSEAGRKVPFNKLIDMGASIDMSNDNVAHIVKTGRESSFNTRAMSYSAGLSYSVLDSKNLVAFISYGKSFDPTMQIDPVKGTNFGNKTATGVDGGIKGIVRGPRNLVFRYTVSLYRITEKNAAEVNLPWALNPSLADSVDDVMELPDYYVPLTSQGKGMAIDVSGDNLFTPGLSLNGKIDWLDKRYLEFPSRDDPSNPDFYRIGKRYTNIPVRTIGAGVSYRPQFGFLKGFGIGVTYTYQPERLMNYYEPANVPRNISAISEYYLPSQQQWSGFIKYTRKFGKKYIMTAQLNVKNITDDMTITVGSYMPNGREILGTLSFEY